MRRTWISAVIWLGNVHRRMLALFFGIAGPEVAYWVSGLGAKIMYRLLAPLRFRSESQCKAALAGHVPPNQIPRIAEQSFISRVWNLTDLMLASRQLRPRTFEQYGGRIPEPHLSTLLDWQRNKQPTILVTVYYGSYDLLPVFLGYNGARAAIVYLPHGNEGYDAWRKMVRSQSGCEMVEIAVAAKRLAQVLGAGGTVGIVADHHSAERGIPVTFLGIPAKALRSVGLLAWRYQANVVVAALRRVNNQFRFQFVIADVINAVEAASKDDTVAYITNRYLRAMERIILEDPTQYLWAYARWGAEHAAKAAGGLMDEGLAALGGVRDGHAEPDR